MQVCREYNHSVKIFVLFLVIKVHLSLSLPMRYGIQGVFIVLKVAVKARLGSRHNHSWLSTSLSKTCAILKRRVLQTLISFLNTFILKISNYILNSCNFFAFLLNV